MGLDCGLKVGLMVISGACVLSAILIQNNQLPVKGITRNYEEYVESSAYIMFCTNTKVKFSYKMPTLQCAHKIIKRKNGK